MTLEVSYYWSGASTNYNYILEKGNADIDNYALLIRPSANEHYFECADPVDTQHSDANTSVAITSGAWHHFAITFDDATDSLRFYLNGVLLGNTTKPETIKTTITDNLHIGRQIGGSGSYFFGGALDEIRLTNAVRSAEWMRAQDRSMRDSYITYGAIE